MNAPTPAATQPDTPSAFEWLAHVSACSIWVEGWGEEAPSIAFIDAIQRRRLSALAKATLGVMHACVAQVGDYQIVYASRHGELARTTELLKQLAAKEEVSPIGFSLAVLNGTVGVYSIATANQAPISAVSAGAHTFEMGLLEAATQARTAATPVLYVYADAPVPAVYGRAPQQTPAHAIALLLHGQAAADRVHLQLTSAAKQGVASEETQALAFATAWPAKRNGAWSDHGHQFAWGFA